MADTETRESELDARGLNCPLPVLKARKRLKAMPAGARLKVLATDPKAPGDFRHFCEATGMLLVDSVARGDEFEIVIEKID